MYISESSSLEPLQIVYSKYLQMRKHPVDYLFKIQYTSYIIKLFYMGSWNYGIFDDDTAYDFTEDIKSNPIDFFKKSFQTALDSEKIDIDDCHAVTVSAAYIDSLLHGTVYRTDNEDVKDEGNVNNFKTLHPNLDVAPLKPLALEALKKVLSDASELKDVWIQNEELYPKWKQSLEELIARLQ